MKIVEKRLDEIRPYERNPRRNNAAVEYVANSLREFGWKQPIVIDGDGVIVAGHTRYKAALSLGWDTAPCVIADDLTPEQVKAYRLADNKVAEAAEWDMELLDAELTEIMDALPGIDMTGFGFDDQPDLGEYVDSFFDRGVEKAYKQPVFEVKVTCADQPQVDGCLDLLRQNGYAAKQL